MLLQRIKNIREINFFTEGQDFTILFGISFQYLYCSPTPPHTPTLTYFHIHIINISLTSLPDIRMTTP